MEHDFVKGQRVTLQAEVLEVYPRDLVVMVTFGEGVKRRLTVSASSLRDMDGIPQVAQRVTLEGQVDRTLAHHNGVTGVTVSFGQGMSRKIVVPAHALQAVQDPAASAARNI